MASWLPVLRGLTPHGPRHGPQTWMDEDGIPEMLKTERMGHEMPGMHGVYGHVSPGMRAVSDSGSGVGAAVGLQGGSGAVIAPPAT